MIERAIEWVRTNLKMFAGISDRIIAELVMIGANKRVRPNSKSFAGGLVMHKIITELKIIVAITVT